MTGQIELPKASVMVSHPLLLSQSFQAETDTGKGGGLAQFRRLADSFTLLQPVIVGERSLAVEARRADSKLTATTQVGLDYDFHRPSSKVRSRATVASCLRSWLQKWGGTAREEGRFPRRPVKTSNSTRSAEGHIDASRLAFSESGR
jgi:hypothetical protein